MISVYGLEASQKCITPSACTAVVELVVLAVSSAGPFSFLVAFELSGSSECIAAICPSYLMQEGWPVPAASASLQSL